MSNRRNAKSAENVWLAACALVDQANRGRCRGLKFSRGIDQPLAILQTAVLGWVDAAFDEVYPAKARRNARLAAKRAAA